MMSSPVDPESTRPASATSTHSSFSMSSSICALPNEICVAEEVKCSIHIALENFKMDEEQKQMEFLSSLSSSERAYVHRLSAHLNLKSKSIGRGSNRFLTVSKRVASQYFHTPASFSLSKTSSQQIHSLIQHHPLSNKERMDLTPKLDRGIVDISREFCKTTPGKLNTGVPQVPPSRSESEFANFRNKLPIIVKRDEIIGTIKANKVTLISGATGCGKTTQVPQIILDESCWQAQPCRIICTQPRRISAVSIAERVAHERGEKIGQTVGYQIRLESRVSPKTILTYCTHGVLLRTLMSDICSLQTVSHVIVDEVNERGRFCDFLLMTLREVLCRSQHTKLILMSTSCNTRVFENFFNQCPVIDVPRELFDVEQFFLEDILRLTKYTNERMHAFMEGRPRVEERLALLKEWCEQMKKSDDGSVSVCSSEGDDVNDYPLSDIYFKSDGSDVHNSIQPKLDETLARAWFSGDNECFSMIIKSITTENVAVDCAHSDTLLTPLMIAATRGRVKVVDQLLILGASVQTRSINGWTALDWAEHFDHSNVVELLTSYGCAVEESNHEEDILVSGKVPAAESESLSAYLHTSEDKHIDIDLIMTLIHEIHNSNAGGGILVFLPGYEDIVNLKDRIFNVEGSIRDIRPYSLFLLHSKMDINTLQRVFTPLPNGTRKIILSTNITESSVTIEDVAFVIDTGKVNQRLYDAPTSLTMLGCVWVSKDSVTQRIGRAGRCRPGKAYHLFSKVHYEAMRDHQEPEISRYPLQELCLHAKLLAPASCSIVDYLAKAPDAPPFLRIRNSVSLVKKIDALDPWEDLTELGHHLTDLPVEPKYGKMILYSVVLKCLDPVLTIVSTLSYNDPFLLSTQPEKRQGAYIAKQKFSAGTLSDHMVLLRAFQAWQRAKAEGYESEFCRKNYVAASTMEMILHLRTQLLGQLRASGFVRARGGGDIRDLNTYSENWVVVKAALLAGHYPNIIRIDRVKKQFTTLRENIARAHPSSILSPSVGSNFNTHKKMVNSLPTDWLIYGEITRSQKVALVKCNTVVSPILVALFSGPSKLPHDASKQSIGQANLYESDFGSIVHESSDSEGEKEDDEKHASLILDDWISFHLESDVLTLTLSLRQKWHALFLRRMRSPAKPWSPVDEAIVRAVVGVIMNEEVRLGIQQPAGIGQRPRPMSTENTTPNDNRCDYIWQRRGVTAHPDPIRLTSLTSPAEPTPFRMTDSSVSTDSHRGNIEIPPNETCCYFSMRCEDNGTIETALMNDAWTIDASNEAELDKAFCSGRPVYLIISVQNSSCLNCYGKMIGPIMQIENRTRSTFPVKWIQKASLSYSRLMYLCDFWGRDWQIRFDQDGLRLEQIVGDLIIQCWNTFGGIEEDSDEGHGDAGEDMDITPTPNYARGFHQRWMNSSRCVQHRNYQPDCNQMGPVPKQYNHQPKISIRKHSSPTRMLQSQVFARDRISPLRPEMQKFSPNEVNGELQASCGQNSDGI